MINWSDQIPDGSELKTLSIIRTPKSVPLQAIITSDAIIGTFTHFYNRRTIPCTAPHCKPCTDGCGNRWHGYLGAYSVKTHRHFIFEFTAKAAEDFKIYRELQPTLRGCQITAARRGIRVNDPVVIQCRPADLAGIKLPDPPDVKRILAIIWGLTSKAIKPASGYAYSERFAVDSDLLAAAAGLAPEPNGNGKH
jgi:hypothetical protein